MEQGQKFDSGKPQWLLLLGAAIGLEGVLKVLEFGAKKYKADSWQQVPDGERRYTEALIRHQVAIAKGEFLDPESGLPHAWHVACNAIFIAWFVAKRLSEFTELKVDPDKIEAAKAVGLIRKRVYENANEVMRAAASDWIERTMGPSYPAGCDDWVPHNSRTKPTGIFNNHKVDVCFGNGLKQHAVFAAQVDWLTVTYWRKPK